MAVVIAQPSPTATSSSSAPLSVCATDCDRCWSAPKVLRPPSSEINNWLDEVACALAGGRGEDEEKVAAANAPSSSSAASSSSTYPNARGLSHKVSAELKPHTGYLDLLVTWNNAETGATERARVSLPRVSPEEEELKARRGAVSLALASGRAAGAAAAELAAQNVELAAMAESAQKTAMASASHWMAREGELFAKFAAVLNEKKAEAARWRQLAEAGGAGAGSAARPVAAARMSLGPAGGGGGRAPAASGANRARGEPMLIEGAPAPAAAAAENDLYDGVAATEDDDELDGEEDGCKSDSGGSRCPREDEGLDDDDDDF